MIADPGTRGKNEDRVIAYTNAMIRIVALLAIAPSTATTDGAGDILAALSGSRVKEPA